MSTIQLNTGQTLQLKIKRLGINGEGIGYYKRLIVFVPRALPGEEIIAKLEEAVDLIQSVVKELRSLEGK